MRGAYVLLAVLIAVSGCGIRRPLIAPKDIPAHEEKLRKKQQQRDEFKRQREQQPATAPTPQV